jgi:tetratricopeptide (TPR) repeat protein
VFLFLIERMRLSLSPHPQLSVIALAMRYNVYVVTAAQFVANLYESLAGGLALGEGVTLGRKQLNSRPLREIAFAPRPLQDWMVPIVYEAAPVVLVAGPAQKVELKITLSGDAPTPASGAIPRQLERRPDAGFFGRDETLLALDRAFDSRHIVLLHAYAGSGKTATAAEFARWYHLTGGIEVPALFTSFEHKKTLAQALNETIGCVFGGALEQSGIHWLALSDEARRDVALQVLARVSVLWIWDNVEPIAGFPTGMPSAWTVAEQQALANFLRAAQNTKAKILLTSRRDERIWLGELPERIKVPPMPMQERVQLARALAERHGRSLQELSDWMPLLRFTGGNPLTIAVLVGQALRDGLKNIAQIESLVARLRLGEKLFEDEESEGRAKSLSASLSYGFEHAFNDNERKQLALLHLFQGFVAAGLLCLMGDEEEEWCLLEVRGLTLDRSIFLLDRAAEIGLLTFASHTYYFLHPVVSWFLGNLFSVYYPSQAASGSTQSRSQQATHAYVSVMGLIGAHYHRQFNEGNNQVIAEISAQEDNLLHAWRQAHAPLNRRAIIGTMQALRSLYGHMARSGEWARLVNEVIPEFVDPDTDGPLIGWEKEWRAVTEYRVGIAVEKRSWSEAERLQRLCVDSDRKQVAPVSPPSAGWHSSERSAVRSLAGALHGLGHIYYESRKPECLKLYQEAFALTNQLNDNVAAAAVALEIGRAYQDIPNLCDLEQSERWLRRGLELARGRDQQSEARLLGQLGAVAFQRFIKGLETGQSQEELLHYLNVALQSYLQAIARFPAEGVEELGISQCQIGNIYLAAGDINKAMTHWSEAVQHLEKAGNVYDAGQVRFNAALGLLQGGRVTDALQYAHAALANFDALGNRAEEMILAAKDLIAEISHAMKMIED